MTLPQEIIFPLRPDQIKSGDPTQLELYIRDLVYQLTDMYQSVAQNVNGTLKLFSPTVFGFSTRGTATYSRQTGWYLRQGLITDLWFDIEWTGHTGTGAMIIELPYKAAVTTDVPWVGAFFTTMTLTAGYSNIFVAANSGSTDGVVLQSGSGVPYINLAIAANGRITGHVRYVGQEFEG